MADDVAETVETRSERVVILLKPSEKRRYQKMCASRECGDFSRHAYNELIAELEAWEAAN